MRQALIVMTILITEQTKPKMNLTTLNQRGSMAALEAKILLDLKKPTQTS